MEVISVITKIKEVAVKNTKKSKSQKTRIVTKDNIKVFECFRQGDLYVFRVPEDWPVGEELKRDKIADGVSLGSTHILMGDFKVYTGVKPLGFVSGLHARVALGYAFDARDNTVVTHLEHDHYCLEDGGRFQVMHQVDLRTLQKARD